jgi:hypothetical protein
MNEVIDIERRKTLYKYKRTYKIKGSIPDCIDSCAYTCYCHSCCSWFDICGIEHDPDEWLPSVGMDRESYDSMMHAMEKDD